MPDFPVLKTGAATQYPLHRSTRFQTGAVQFLDGSRQRYRIFGAGHRRWNIQLDCLDDAELAALTAFLETQGTTPFAFTDPATGQTVPRCVIAQDRFVGGSRGEMLAGAQLVIEEIL